MNECLHKVAEECGTDLSNRNTASSLRQSVLGAIESGCQIAQIDLSNVRTISDSFADELFVVMVESKDLDWFKEHISIIGANEGVRLTILEAIDQRINFEPA